jgi:hypothetical protein
MARLSKENHVLFLLIVGLMGWFLPGAGHLLLKEEKRAIIIFATITLTFCVGLYVGSVGVIDPVGAKPWYVAQIMNSPLVAVLGHLTAGGGFPVYGRPNEIGQIYTGVAGLLNLLCIINAVYLAQLHRIELAGD